MSINKWYGTGNLGGDPELKSTQGGTPVLTFSIAVNERIKKGDKWEDYTNWVDCVLYGKRAESLSRILHKGTKVAVEGRWHQNRWEKDGKKHTRWEVNVYEVELMSRDEQEPQQPEPQQQTFQQVEDEYLSDIPF